MPITPVAVTAMPITPVAVTAMPITPVAVIAIAVAAIAVAPVAVIAIAVAVVVIAIAVAVVVIDDGCNRPHGPDDHCCNRHQGSDGYSDPPAHWYAVLALPACVATLAGVMNGWLALEHTPGVSGIVRLGSLTERPILGGADRRGSVLTSGASRGSLLTNRWSLLASSASRRSSVLTNRGSVLASSASRGSVFASHVFVSHRENLGSGIQSPVRVR